MSAQPRQFKPLIVGCFIIAAVPTATYWEEDRYGVFEAVSEAKELRWSSQQ